MSLDLDFAGRLRKIRVPKTHSNNAIYEAVANAFDATDELGDKGQIVVRVLQKNSVLSLANNDDFELEGYEIIDNGIGFNAEQWDSFKRSDTTKKKGGKGVGRLLWLKVFSRSEVDSVFEDKGKRFRRTFHFAEKFNGVDDKTHLTTEVPNTTPLGTKVRLLDPKSDRRVSLADDPHTLAVKLLEFFLLHFAVTSKQQVVIQAIGSGKSVNVGDLYEEIIGERHKIDEFQIREHKFVLHHLFMRPPGKNLFHLCAHRRVVESELVNMLVPDISRASAVTVHGSYRYHAYVTGEYLDEITDDERTSLRFAKYDDLQFTSDDEVEDAEEVEEAEAVINDKPVSKRPQIEGITREELYETLGSRIRDHLDLHLGEVRRKKEEQLEAFAATEQPQFRPFVARAKEHLERLPAKPSKKAIELALYEAKMDGRQELTQIVDALVSERASMVQVAEYTKRLIDKFATEATRHNQSSLAEYVCTRKAVIEVLKSNLRKSTESINAYEEEIHNLFFPRFQTSDNIPVGPQDDRTIDIENLWLIDERLVFHRLLSSDQPLAKMRNFLKANDEDKNEEIDIVIFDPTFITSEGDCPQSVALVEFKRPGKTDYSVAKNPIKQIIDAAVQVRSGSMLAVDGELKQIPPTIRAHGYIICDLVDQLKSIAMYYGMKPSPDGVGLWNYNEPLNLFYEIIPYSKMVEDAARRNAAYFKKLGM